MKSDYFRHHCTTNTNDTSLLDIEKVVRLLNRPTSDIAYFNNAGKVPIPPLVEKVGIDALHQECSPWMESAESISEIVAETRSLFAKLVGARALDIAITPSTGFTLTMVAHNLLRTGVLSRDEKSKILILQDEMSSEVYCWQEVCRESNSELLIIPHPNSIDNDWTNLISDALISNEDIKVVCVPQVHWSDGSYLDLKRIGEICRQRNIIFIVDGTQSVGICQLNVHDIQCHILVASVHKWLLGPHGQSLCYVHQLFHDSWLPLDQHERSRTVFQDEVYDATENNIDSNGYPEALIKGAARLDSGGKKNPILLPMVNEGLRIVNRINLVEAQMYLKSITDSILVGGEKIGFGVQPGPRAGHIIGLRPKSVKLSKLLTPAKMVEVANNLKQKSVYLAVRSGAFRIAPYLDTTMGDVETLLHALETECNQLIALTSDKDENHICCS